MKTRTVNRYSVWGELVGGGEKIKVMVYMANGLPILI
jgi:hypothetical protein